MDNTFFASLLNTAATLPGLRDYQQDIAVRMFQQAAQGHRNVLGVAPTGAGKTVLMAAIVRMLSPRPGCAIAHRAELVSQLSLALARNSIPHRIVGSAAVRKQCAALHMDELGRSWVQATAPFGVASVDTIVNHADAWLGTVQYWLPDEAHHVLPDNKWGKAGALFTHPSVRCFGFTATPERADGKGLIRSFNVMVEGPTPETLMAEGRLTRYRVFSVPSDVDYSDVTTGATGDLSMPKLRAAVHRSKQFVGDVVANWQRHALGKLSLFFGVDIETAGQVAERFRGAGIAAEVLSGKTDAHVRSRLLRQFKHREILVLCTVDIVSEGFDLPAVECVILGRKTESLTVHRQQIGRALRPMGVPEGLPTAAERLAAIAGSVKPYAIIIDHVMNVLNPKLGLPNAPRAWSLLDRTGRGSAAPSDAIPLRTCLQCLSPYERFRLACPWCGTAPPIISRSGPEFVDGDLVELDPAVIALLTSQRAKQDAAPYAGLPSYIHEAHQNRIIAQHALRSAMTIWCGYHEQYAKLNLREAQKLFYTRYGVDVLTAQTLGKPEAEALTARLTAEMDRHNVKVA